MIYDVAIVGGGIVGRTAALALALAPGPKPRVVLCDPLFGAPRQSGRAITITAASRRVFERLGIWTAVAATAQPVTATVLSDSRDEDAVRRERLVVESRPADAPLAHILTTDALEAALGIALATRGVTVLASPVRALAVRASLATLDTAPGPLKARLVVAADGRGSLLRRLAGVSLVAWDYGQDAITGTIRHTLDHEGRATQHFLPGGPLALLPLPSDGLGFRSSIVWTVRRREADVLLALSREGMAERLDDASAFCLGRTAFAEPLERRPLSFHLARRFVGSRVALVGDAAHVIHPLAGQGLNLGIRDADTLASVVAERMAIGLDPGDSQILADYERRRRFDVTAMAAITDGLNRLFSNDIAPARAIRDLGLSVVARSSLLKALIAAEAAGDADVPTQSSRTRASSGSMIGIPSRMG